MAAEKIVSDQKSLTFFYEDKWICSACLWNKALRERSINLFLAILLYRKELSENKCPECGVPYGSIDSLMAIDEILFTLKINRQIYLMGGGQILELK